MSETFSGATKLLQLKTNIRESQSYLDVYERWLWETTRFFLGDNANFSDNEYTFMLKKNPFPDQNIDAGPYKIGKNIEDAHIFRPGHPLAQKILNELKQNNLDVAEVVFCYSKNPGIISVLKSLVGKSGVMKVSNYTLEALEAEDHVIISAFDQQGEPIIQDIAKKLFSLVAEVNGVKESISEDEKKKLEALEQEAIDLVKAQSAERNSVFFDNEVEKLDQWADDMKTALELELKKLDIDIKTAKTQAKKIINLEEKVKVQREIKEMEKKRNDMRQRLYEAQDEVD